MHAAPLPGAPAQVVEAVAAELQRHAVGCIVVDPVTVSTSGDALATLVGAGLG